MKALHRDWAIEKVRTLSPQSKEKSTLIAIARWADPDGTNSWAAIETISKSTGHSIRTVQRHLQALSSRCTWPRVIKDANYITPEDDFTAEAELKIEYQKSKERTNVYSIHVCTLTEKEREEITGVSKRQMKLPLRTEIEISDSEVTTMQLKLKGKNPIELKEYEETGIISEEVQDLIKSTLDKLVVKDTPTGANKLRDRYYNRDGVRPLGQVIEEG